MTTLVLQAHQALSHALFYFLDDVSLRVRISTPQANSQGSHRLLACTRLDQKNCSFVVFFRVENIFTNGSNAGKGVTYN